MLQKKTHGFLFYETIHSGKQEKEETNRNIIRFYVSSSKVFLRCQGTYGTKDAPKRTQKCFYFSRPYLQPDQLNSILNYYKRELQYIICHRLLLQSGILLWVTCLKSSFHIVDEDMLRSLLYLAAKRKSLPKLYCKGSKKLLSRSSPSHRFPPPGVDEVWRATK